LLSAFPSTSFTFKGIVFHPHPDSLQEVDVYISAENMWIVVHQLFIMKGKKIEG
jgi:hypothetical protein